MVAAFINCRNLRSSGRFELYMSVKAPSLLERKEILKRKLASMKTDPAVDIEKLASYIGTV